MRLIALSLLSIFFQLNSFSQKYSYEYGKVSAGDFEINSFLGDTSVEAIVLYDIGSSQFVRGTNGYDILFKRRTKIKILSQAGIEHSQFEIPFYQEGNIFEKINNLKGVTYNLENGLLNLVNLNVDDIYEEKINDSWKVKKFAMPAVKEGSVIEVEYELTTPYIFNIQDWEFQREIPTLYSKYVVRSIPFFSYVYIKQGISTMNHESSVIDNSLERTYGSVAFKDVINTYILLNVPAFEDETYITSRNDYIKKIDFQLSEIIYPSGDKKEIISTWPQLCNELIKDGEFSKFLEKSKKKASTLEGVSSINADSADDKLKQAVEFVKTNYRWNGINGYFPQKKYKEFVEEKVGNSSNLNLFLTGLLQSVGFEANPVLISTRDHGKIRKSYPFSHYFNYVVTQVKTENGYVLVDATDNLCPYNQLPFNCLNGIGLIVKKDSEEWVKLNNDEVSSIEENIRLSFTDGLRNLIGEFNVSATNHDATFYRKRYSENSNLFENNLKEKELKLIESIKRENYKELLKPYTVSFKAECPFEVIGEQLFLSPFLNEPLSSNPFKQDNRSYPIDMNYLKKRKYTSKIDIPEGYRIFELPESFSMDNEWMKIDYGVHFNEQEGLIEIAAEYSTKKAVYEADDYRNLKYMFNEMIKKFNEKIIFEKFNGELQTDINL